MAAHNYQTFIGVANIQSYLGNIRIVAEANGWTTDKDRISAGGELYIHSHGLYGNQNLYFSFKIRSAIDDTTKKYLVWHCNTGFDGGASWDAQPGRFSVLPKAGFLEDNPRWYSRYGDDQYYMNINTADMTHWFSDPCSQQTVLANAQDIICVQRIIHSYNTGSVFAGYSSFVVGAMDSTTGSAETELNFTLGAPWGHAGAVGTMFQPYMRLPKHDISGWKHRTIVQPYGLLYGGAAAVVLPDEGSEGYSGETPKSFYSSVGSFPSSGVPGSNDDTYSPRPAQRGVDYGSILISNPGMARTVFHKPFITVEDQSGDAHYCYPTRASLPYYACALLPYIKPEQVVSMGSRSFKVFPLLTDNDTTGFAIEV